MTVRVEIVKEFPSVIKLCCVGWRGKREEVQVSKGSQAKKISLADFLIALFQIRSRAATSRISGKVLAYWVMQR
jgi:hypothetical protein